jgi:hypothetical protein
MRLKKEERFMTQSFDDDLPIPSRDIDHVHQEVNSVAVAKLPMLLADLEEVLKDKDLLEQYEIDFLGDLYARMVVSVYMGFFPDRMAKDAIDAQKRLNKLAEEHDNDND